VAAQGVFAVSETHDEKPSAAKATPKTSPNLAMKFGHSRPSSKLSTVPVTTPTANRAIITFDHRLASVRYSGSPVRRCSNSVKTTSDGRAMAKQTNGMCTANDIACI